MGAGEIEDSFRDFMGAMQTDDPAEVIQKGTQYIEAHLKYSIRRELEDPDEMNIGNKDFDEILELASALGVMDGDFQATFTKLDQLSSKQSFDESDREELLTSMPDESQTDIKKSLDFSGDLKKDISILSQAIFAEMNMDLADFGKFQDQEQQDSSEELREKKIDLIANELVTEYFSDNSLFNQYRAQEDSQQKLQLLTTEGLETLEIALSQISSLSLDLIKAIVAMYLYDRTPKKYLGNQDTPTIKDTLQELQQYIRKMAHSIQSADETGSQIDEEQTINDLQSLSHTLEKLESQVEGDIDEELKETIDGLQEELGNLAKKSS